MSPNRGVVAGATVVVITNAHVAQGAKQVRIGYADGTGSRGTVVATDEVTDIAVVRTERDNLPVPKCREQLPRQGDIALAIGSPLGFQNTVTAGTVSGLHREIPGSAGRTQSLVDLIQTDAPISPGSSGGALLDAQGRVIGINEAYLPPRSGAVSIGFAIPSGTAVETANELLDDGTATHPYLGLKLGRLTSAIREQFDVQADHGALVHGIEENGPADAAGLRQGDVIVQVGEQRVKSRRGRTLGAAPDRSGRQAAAGVFPRRPTRARGRPTRARGEPTRPGGRPTRAGGRPTRAGGRPTRGQSRTTRWPTTSGPG